MPSKSLKKLPSRDLCHLVSIKEAVYESGKVMPFYKEHTHSWAHITLLDDHHARRLIPVITGVTGPLCMLYAIQMRYNETILPGLYIEWGHNRAQIRRVINRNEQHRWLDIIAEEIRYE